MPLAFVALGVLVVVAVMLFAVGKADPLEPEPVVRGRTGDDADLDSPAKIAALRLPIVLRGYRMDDVDAVLDRLSRELAERDTEIKRLRAAASASAPATASGLPRRTVAAREPERDVFGRPIPPVNQHSADQDGADQDGADQDGADQDGADQRNEERSDE